MCGCLTKFGEILHEAYVYREKKVRILCRKR